MAMTFGTPARSMGQRSSAGTNDKRATWGWLDGVLASGLGDFIESLLALKQAFFGERMERWFCIPYQRRSDRQAVKCCEHLDGPFDKI